MNKAIKIIITAVIVCISFITMGAKETFAAPKYVRIVGEPVVVRADAGSSSKFIKRVHHDDRLLYLSEKNDKSGTKWYQVKLSDNKKGWVTSVYTETVDEKNVGRLEVNTKLLNIRSEASLTGNILGTTEIGTKFDYFSTAKDSSNQLWYLVHFKEEGTAWLLGTYCKDITGSKSNDKSNIKTAEKDTTAKDKNIVQILTSPVNVREKASLTGRKIGTTSQGKKYEYLASAKDENGHVWYKIRYSSEKTGWVLGSLSKLVGAEDKSESNTTVSQVQVTGKSVNVRASASTSSKKLGVALNGKKFTCLSSKKDSAGTVWYRIQYKSDTEGWVSSKYTRLITTTKNTEEKTSVKKVRIEGSPVIVRSSASTSSKKIGTTYVGKEYPYLASKKDSDGKTWYRIQYKTDTKGWVIGTLSKIVTEDSKSTESKAETETTVRQVVITASPAIVRASASTGSKSIGRTVKGKKFRLISTKKDSNGRTWYKIQYKSDKKGWVLGSLAKIG